MFEGTDTAINVKEPGLLFLVEKQRQVDEASVKRKATGTDSPHEERPWLPLTHMHRHADFQ